MKKVSIIIPVYNMEEWVESGIKCITEQTYENLEIIIIDDGSKDGMGSGNVVREISTKKAEEYVRYMENENTDLVLCSFSMFDGEKVFRTVKKADGLKRTGEDARKDYYEHMFMYGERGIQGAAWFKLYKTDIIRKNGIEFPKLRKSEDDVFVARYVNCIDSFYMTGDVLCRYYVNSYKRFWDKYRFDIFDTSRQSTMYVKDIVLSWNRNNKDVLQRIYDDYFHKTFGSFCFLFNPNLKLNRKARYARLKEITDIFMDDISCDGIEINHPIFKCMKKKNYRAIYVRIVLHIWKHKFD